jgi:hypothetical protein
MVADCELQIEVPMLDVVVTLALPPVPTVILIALEVAVVGDAQAELEVITTVIEAPVVRVVEV